MLDQNRNLSSCSGDELLTKSYPNNCVLHQGIIDYTRTETRQVFSRMLVKTIFFKELFITT